MRNGENLDLHVEHADAPLFVKLPDWFKIPTPLGNYNPDWATLREEQAGQFLSRARDKGWLRHREAPVRSQGWKIKFGEAPYGALKVDYFFHHDPKALIEVSPDYAKRGGM